MIPEMFLQSERISSEKTNSARNKGFARLCSGKNDSERNDTPNLNKFGHRQCKQYYHMRIYARGCFFLWLSAWRRTNCVVMNASSKCAMAGCERFVFDGHRFCCKECKISSNTIHGGRCSQRQSARAADDRAEERHPQQAQPPELVRDLVQHILPSLSASEKRKWLLDLVRAFHADRHPHLMHGHAISTLLTQELAKLV